MNRLGDCHSPYLQQHAHHPVHWHPWDEVALAEASRTNRLIFLSIGYATCHWCHVMAHESFEDPETAALLNQHMVSIKVDREERPDLDALYMRACMMLRGQGGWPLTVIMTPDLSPIYAATYLPRIGGRGQVGMQTLIPRIASLWETEPEKLAASGAELVEVVTTSFRLEQGNEPNWEQLFRRCDDELMRAYDRVHGGFGPAPKFPLASRLLYALQADARRDLRDAALHTLKKMQWGGIHDHLAGGFHRYSTDERWQLPHFEKMLYDQAQLLTCYALAYASTHDASFQKTAASIVAFVHTHLRHPDGLLMTGVDADSEGEEGTFYYWSEAELVSVLGRPLSDIRGYFATQALGNVPDEASGEYRGNNVLTIQRADEPNTEAWYEQAFDVLRLARAKRPHPGIDHKVLLEWNACWASALSTAAVWLDRVDWLHEATRILDRLWLGFRRADGGLWQVCTDGEYRERATLDGYAHLADATLAQYFGTGDPGMIDRCMALIDEVYERFWNPDLNAFQLADKHVSHLFASPTEWMDNATPAGTSVLLHVLLSLFHVSGDVRWWEKYQAVQAIIAGSVASVPTASTYALRVIRGATRAHIRILGKPREEAIREVAQLVRRFPSVTGSVQAPEDHEKWSVLCPDQPRADEPSYIVCLGQTCLAPLYSLEALMQTLEGFDDPEVGRKR